MHRRGVGRSADLALRGMSESIRTRVSGARDKELDALAKRLLKAPTLEKALGRLAH